MTLSAFMFLLAGVLLNAGAQLLLKAGTNAARARSSVELANRPVDRPARVAHPGPILGRPGLLRGQRRRVDHRRCRACRCRVAYPMLSLGYVVNAVAAQCLFGEALAAQRWLGIGFIIVGVYLVARS